jgi:DNA topoisomerase IA
VVRHYLACVSQPAIGYGTTATVDIAGEKFTASGLMITAKNYLEVYCYDSWGTSTIPNFEVGQQVSYPVPELAACLLVVNSASCGAVFLHLQR